MKQTIAVLAFFVITVNACDPWIEDCTKKDDLPREGIDWYYMYGIIAYLKAI